MPFCHVSLTASRPLPPGYPRHMRTIGDHLRKERLDLGLLQKDVAQRLGVDPSSVYNWENGRSSPKLSLMPQVLEFLEYVPIVSSSESVGEKVKALRRLMGVRQEDLARHLAVDPSTLGRWERGEGKPLPRHRLKVEAFLNSPPCPEAVRELEQ